MLNRRDYPAWLAHAETLNERVEEDSTGRIIWLDGEWLGGEWRGGAWYGGVWYDGVWHDGVWHDGEWRGGVWRDGVWLGGVWRGGAWYGGVWRGGVWRDGVWGGGAWRGGEWYGGEWLGGVWRGGAWYGGMWHDGEWRGGKSAATRCQYCIVGDGEYIFIGCEGRTEKQWERVIRGKDKAPEGAPPRDSEAWRLLVAAFRAQVAYQKSLQEDRDGTA